MSDSANRYSESQILCGLREVWRNIVGDGASFDASTRLVEYMKADRSWDGLDLADVFRALERFFGFKCDKNEWDQFFGFDFPLRSLTEWEETVVPQLTFGALARFIAARADAISFSPMLLLGRECRPAGVFLGMQQLAIRTCRRDVRFAPSSRIIGVLRGRSLDRFWNQLSWLTQDGIPKLPAFWCNVTSYGFVLGFLMLLAGLVVGWAVGAWSVALLAFATAATACSAAWLYKYCANPLPSGIESFRDLATRIAETEFDAVNQQS